MTTLSHLDARGELRMVDVTDKQRTERSARAEGYVRMRPETLEAILGDAVPKGSVLSCAKLAGIQAAKRTAELIPLCHPLCLSWLDVQIAPAADGLRLEATARVTEATGVEMEALVAVSVAALAIYDMCKAVDREMRIEGVRLLEKQGGRSGTFVAGAVERDR
ncbi:MAG: cyclic pyranopterin monophosphate synthase MoaC [Deltaproteobacteria bacterium]|nr:cyclic pyranopterin monophosphate synthase MoaC [Deltaproteobacteria bacterium]